mmetsp:Transcript_26465/g.61742  ORF Transcript_26465/g.61742 Transcript_26465/m.61742 type:complete len:85 (+) Transcript_26465:1841-2095(+)
MTRCYWGHKPQTCHVQRPSGLCSHASACCGSTGTYPFESNLRLDSGEGVVLLSSVSITCDTGGKEVDLLSLSAVIRGPQLSGGC